MTQEMNKPNWEREKIYAHIGGGIYVYPKPKQRVLNPLIAEFFERCCNMERLK